jgi:hypothetical protein
MICVAVFLVEYLLFPFVAPKFTYRVIVHVSFKLGIEADTFEIAQIGTGNRHGV